jgi:hypothetical protein
LDLLKKGQEKLQLKPATKAHGECAEEEKVSDNGSVKRALSTLHYSNSMDEVSDPELWQLWNHGMPASRDPAIDHRRYADGHIEQVMRDINDVLRRRFRRLETEHDVASEANDIEEMHNPEMNINECEGLMYNIGWLSVLQCIA